MGTRNLTCVFKDGEYKLVKYCQWDGQPHCQGQDIINFLIETYKPKKFAKRLDQIVEVSNEEVLKRFQAVGGDKLRRGNFATFEAFQIDNAHLDRDMGGGKFLFFVVRTSTSRAIFGHHTIFSLPKVVN